MHQLVELILGSAVSVAAPAIAGAAVKLFQKLRFDVDEAKRRKIEATVTDVLYEVEEWAAERIKAKLPVNSGQKLSRAVARLVDKVPGISEAQAELLVRQTLPLLAMGASWSLRRKDLADASAK
jgi:hypothetical protein